MDKPAGVTVNSKDQVSLANGIAHYFMEHGIKRKVRFLNRLDRDTTGCIVIAKSGLAQSYINNKWMITHLKSGTWLLLKALSNQIRIRWCFLWIEVLMAFTTSKF